MIDGPLLRVRARATLRTLRRLGPVAVLALLAALRSSAAAARSPSTRGSTRWSVRPNRAVPLPQPADAEFLRRLSIDLLGSIPASDEARRFLDDRTPTSGRPRAAFARSVRVMPSTIDARLRRDASGAAQLRRDQTRRLEQYLFESFVSNKPYDQLAREILAADGTDPKARPAVKFYLERNADPNLLTRGPSADLLWARSPMLPMPRSSPHRPLSSGRLLRSLRLSAARLRNDRQDQAREQRQARVLRRKGGRPGDISVGLRPKEKPAWNAVRGCRAAWKLTSRISPSGPGISSRDGGWCALPASQVQPPRAVPTRRWPRESRLRRNIANRMWALMMGQGWSSRRP